MSRRGLTGWPLLTDPVLVASCIPGATLAAAAEPGVFQGTLTVKFGPTVVTFRGEARINFDHGARRCTIEGRGLDQRGVSRATDFGSDAVTGEQETDIAVTGGYHVAGPLETFARRAACTLRGSSWWSCLKSDANGGPARVRIQNG